MLFVEFSSTFNAIIPDILVDKQAGLDFSPATWAWIKKFLTDCPQTVKISTHTSSTFMLSTGSPQGCVLSPLLYARYTNDFTPIHSTNTIIKFVDDTAIVGGRISLQGRGAATDSDWHKADPSRLHINGECVERVSTFKFLAIHISEDLTLSANTTSLVKKAQQSNLFLLKRKWSHFLLRRNKLEKRLL